MITRGAVLTKAQRRAAEAENLNWPARLIPMPRATWPPTPYKPPIEVWRSRFFLVQIYAAPGGVERLSIICTTRGAKDWADGISWDDLQKLKAECGRGDKMAVEIFPADIDVVNEANMRHLWVLAEPLPFAWRRQQTSSR